MPPAGRADDCTHALAEPTPRRADRSRGQSCRPRGARQLQGAKVRLRQSQPLARMSALQARCAVGNLAFHAKRAHGRRGTSACESRLERRVSLDKHANVVLARRRVRTDSLEQPARVLRAPDSKRRCPRKIRVECGDRHGYLPDQREIHGPRRYLCAHARSRARARRRRGGCLDVFRPRWSLLAEIALLRHQLTVLQRSVARPRVTGPRCPRSSLPRGISSRSQCSAACITSIEGLHDLAPSLRLRADL